MGAEHSGVVIRGKEGTVPALEEAVVLKGQEGPPLSLCCGDILAGWAGVAGWLQVEVGLEPDHE